MIPLSQAHLCESCQIIYARAEACPVCANANHSLNLAGVLNRKKESK